MRMRNDVIVLMTSSVFIGVACRDVRLYAYKSGNVVRIFKELVMPFEGYQKSQLLISYNRQY
jgi:hypothetical protein